MGESGLRYLEAGAGNGRPALVLLHAFPMVPEMWQDQLDGLGSHWHVVAPAVPGLASMDAMADSVAALIGDLGLGPVVLGGLSLGGYVTFALLRRHRAAVRAVVLADTRAGADTPEVRDRRTAQQADVGAANSTKAVVDAMVDALPGATTKGGRPDLMARLRALMEQASPDWVIGALEAMKGRPDSTPDLAGLDLPAVVLVGEEDRTSPPDVARDMAARLPDARLAAIPGAGHLSNLENPSRFNAELAAFLESQP